MSPQLGRTHYADPETLARLNELEREVERLKKEVKHWQEARQAALDGGDILKREVERLRSELHIMNDGGHCRPDGKTLLCVEQQENLHDLQRRYDALFDEAERIRIERDEYKKEQCPHDYGLAKAALMREPELEREVERLKKRDDLLCDEFNEEVRRFEDVVYPLRPHNDHKRFPRGTGHGIDCPTFYDGCNCKPDHTQQDWNDLQAEVERLRALLHEREELLSEAADELVRYVEDERPDRIALRNAIRAALGEVE